MKFDAGASRRLDMVVRESVRAIAIANDGRVLLFNHLDRKPVDPSRPWLLDYWVTPGGGVKQGESMEQALKRELHEEAHMIVKIGARVALRVRPLEIKGRLVESRESYFIVRPESEAIDSRYMTEHERQTFVEAKWWSIDELQSHGVTVLPPGLPALLARLASGEVPPEPVVLDE